VVLTLEDSVENVVDLQSVVDFLLELETSFVAASMGHLVVKVVKLNITRVNDVTRLSEVVLLNLGLSLVDSALEEIVTEVALEAADVLTLEALVTELLDRRSISQLSDNSSLLSKSLTEHVGADVRILHPVGGEQVTEARSDVGTIDISLATTVRSPR